MNKKAFLIIVLVVIVGAAILLLRGAQDENGLEAEINKVATSKLIEQSKDVKIDITNYSFMKQVVKVKKGSKVTWQNQDSAHHTVTSDNGSYLDSSLLAKGQTYEKVFERAGTYRYHCTPHPGMIAAIVVAD